MKPAYRIHCAYIFAAGYRADNVRLQWQRIKIADRYLVKPANINYRSSF